ncbi:MAG: glycosyltransferase family 2 protein, partial [Bacteroidales bacterium]
DTLDVLARLSFRYPLHVVSSEQSRGAAAARNRGAEAASSPIIVFLDDDIEAGPELIAAHAREHGAGAALTTGYLPATTAHRIDFFQIALRRWWEAMFNRMRQPGHRYTFRDVLTGNCAIDTDLFRQVGGFDEQFRCHEDYELGVRAIASGADVRFAPDATGIHHERTTMPRAFARKVDEGRADVALLRKHPRLLTVLPLGVFEQYATPMEFRVRRLVFEWPRAGRLVARTLTRSLVPMEATRLRGRWLRRLHVLLHYWYWRGVRDEVPSLAALRDFRAECRSRPTGAVDRAEVDLAHGLQRAMATIDARRPDAVRVRYGDHVVGAIEAEPGAERLRGTHLKAALARELAGPLVAALGRAGVIPVSIDAGRLVSSGPLPSRALAL